MKKNKDILVLLNIMFLVLGYYTVNAQDNALTLNSETVLKSYTSKNSKSQSQWDLAEKRSKSADSYQFMALRRDFGFINEMLYSGDESVIGKGIVLIDNVIKHSEISSLIKGNKTHKDNFKGWITLYKNDEYQKEVPLYEGYSFFYITEFLYILNDIGWTNRSDENYQWWKTTLKFIEENEWNKWRERSIAMKKKEYWYFLRQRVHMGSHWAGVAMYLNKMTEDKEIKRQTGEVQKQYDLLLKRNLKMVNNAYIWNSTYDNVTGTDASGVNKPIIQDVSHGNHVVAYIISAYELGNPKWTKEDILKLCNTLKNVIYDKQNNIFRDRVDGSSDGARPGWGNFVADGWVKLASYDMSVKEIFMEFGKTEMLTKYYQDMQYKATMFKSNQ